MPLTMNISLDQEKELKEKQIMQQQQLFNVHFSHRHPLELSEIHEEDEAVCSGCELDILGSAYICTKPNCNFLLHDLCFDLPRHIRHPSHPKHSLKLLFSPPYSDSEFTCDACAKSGHGFTYHCAACKFDLHVECASLPEFEERDDHQHPLILLYDDKMEGPDFVCYVCGGSVGKGCWSYCCLACKCGAHLECVGSPLCG
ncbi:hypothetical protein BUALT_Bualt01G0176000 [Buddleja alternifolia]|uniref:DC1 domain-containing protein n=1 Tax=Buddleja alternifolia TaxID=168488 RepID=A0AAV6YEY4_9LAMI|nr:hypothetical protein BUALT_Bualt01G0176000 [Buddleja alternifolia]